MLLFQLLISLKQHELTYISFPNSPHKPLPHELFNIWLQPWFLHLYTHTSVGAVQQLWVWICVVFMCRWGLFNMCLKKYIFRVEKITLGLFQQRAPLWGWGASFGIFTFTFSTALCQVNAPWMHLTACWFHPQGLYTLWLVFVSPCQAAELRVNPTAPTGQHRAGSKVCSVCVTPGGVELRDASVATISQHLSLWAWGLSALRMMWNTQLSPGILCRRYSRADGKATFLMFCHAEGESAVCDWFSVCIYTTQLQKHAGA